MTARRHAGPSPRGLREVVETLVTVRAARASASKSTHEQVRSARELPPYPTPAAEGAAARTQRPAERAAPRPDGDPAAGQGGGQPGAPEAAPKR